MRIGRIVAYSAAIAIAAAAALHASVPDAPQAARADDSWLALPSMDATDPGIRQLLLRAALADPAAMPANSPFRSLVGRCGYDDGPAEQYVLTIGDHWFVEDRHVWHVTLSMYGDSADVVIRDGRAVETPPPPPGAPYTEVTAPAMRYVMDRKDLDGIRAAWRDPELWLLPQATHGCTDGHTLMLEACVRGRYGARSRACGGTGRAAGALLWQRLRQTFPDPPPARWQ
ncbi:MAG TPA: hypothetical protein VGD42_12630 [Lysobacter sp.]